MNYVGGMEEFVYFYINNYYMSSLIDFLNTQGVEQFSQKNPQQIDSLKRLVSGDDIKSVLEIGFNAGHFSDNFLSSNPNIHVLSFDLGIHDYVGVGKAFIDQTYPNRHSLILGDSRISIPMFSDKNLGAKFDLIFINGGSDYDTSKSDFLNCKCLAHKDTIVIMNSSSQDNGDSGVWTDAIETGYLFESGKEEYEESGCGMSWGKYNMSYFSKPAISIEMEI